MTNKLTLLFVSLLLALAATVSPRAATAAPVDDPVDGPSLWAISNSTLSSLSSYQLHQDMQVAINGQTVNTSLDVAFQQPDRAYMHSTVYGQSSELVIFGDTAYFRREGGDWQSTSIQGSGFDLSAIRPAVDPSSLTNGMQIL